jgi:hypothetical protein
MQNEPEVVETTLDTPGVSMIYALKLRIAQERQISSTLDIETKYPKVKFFHSLIQNDHVTERSSVVVKTKGKKPQRRVFLLTNCFGEVKMKVPKGKNILSLKTVKYEYLIFNTSHIVILTQERSWFGWTVTVGEIINFGLGQRLPGFLEGIEFKLAKLTAPQESD